MGSLEKYPTWVRGRAFMRKATSYVTERSATERARYTHDVGDQQRTAETSVLRRDEVCCAQLTCVVVVMTFTQPAQVTLRWESSAWKSFVASCHCCAFARSWASSARTEVAVPGMPEP